MQEGTVAFLQMIGITAAIARAQGGRAPLPGLPAQPDVRRRARLVGLARARDRSPSPAPRSASSARGSTRRSTASRSPRACRPPSTWPSTACIDAVVPHEEIADVADRALRVLAARQTWHPDVRGAERPTPRTAPTPTTPRTTAAPGTSSPRPGATDRPGVRRLLRTAATDVVGADRAPAPARRTPGCCWRWPGSAARPAWCSARTGAGRR